MSKIIFTILLSFFGMRPSLAQSVNLPPPPLNDIAAFADHICQTVPLEVRRTKKELSGDVTLSLKGLLKKLLDIGVGAAGKYETETSQNVLQKDLVVVLRETRDCRVGIWGDLKNKLNVPDAPTCPLPLPSVLVKSYGADDNHTKVPLNVSPCFSYKSFAGRAPNIDAWYRIPVTRPGQLSIRLFVDDKTTEFALQLRDSNGGEVKRATPPVSTISQSIDYFVSKPAEYLIRAQPISGGPSNYEIQVGFVPQP